VARPALRVRRMLKRLLVASLALLSSLAHAGDPVLLRGQVVCSGCWTEADRMKTVYGTEGDHACAIRCAKDGLPAALAVYRDGKFTLHPLAAVPALEGERRFALTGKAVEVRGTFEKDVLRAESLREVAWESLGFPTGPPPATKAAAGGAGANAVAPGELVLADLDGFPQKLASLRGRVVVLNFWGTWCLPCREEMPIFSKLQHRFATRGVQVIGASADPADGIKQVGRFAEKLAVNFPIWTGASTDSMAAFGLPTVLPGTVVLDREGKIVARFPGVVTEKALEEAIEKALAAGASPESLRAAHRASRVPS
jgi:peroxiredoxin